MRASAGLVLLVCALGSMCADSLKCRPCKGDGCRTNLKVGDDCGGMLLHDEPVRKKQKLQHVPRRYLLLDLQQYTEIGAGIAVLRSFKSYVNQCNVVNEVLNTSDDAYDICRSMSSEWHLRCGPVLQAGLQKG
jgi:hypothetical protein